MNTLERVLMCAGAVLLAFGGWFMADPQLATFQGAGACNYHALANLPMYRLTVYLTYVGAAFITWIGTN
jgi:hypothetical protein